MKRNLIWAFVGISLFPFAAKAITVEGDSVGTKVVNGKTFVLVKVTSGDNLTAIARQYNTTIQYVREVNKLPDTNIQLGQVLMVPAKVQTNAAQTVVKPATQPVAAEPKPATNGGGEVKKHKVEPGESLFGVARKYNIGVDQIKKWNSLSSDALRVGQVLIVSDPANKVAEVETKPSITETKPVVTPEDKPKQQDAPADKPSEPASDASTQTSPQVNEPGTHVVKPGETLYGIARLYGMDARDLKVLNKLEDPNLKVGQVLNVKMDPPANPNQGTALVDMIVGSKPGDSTAVKEAYPDLKVLTAASNTMIAPEAKVTTYKDKASGKTYKQVEEEGSVGPIEDYITDQTKFYVFHRYLPVGSYVRIDFPEKGQSILAEVTNQLPARDPYLVRVSAKCLDYLMIRQPGANVKVKYVLPAGN